ncbi:MAG: hypothetical protein KVP17_002857 [Porospora cf. gigantea B]|uniref:uncharacterized protein n=1 Tax=Porospora cf. gigantea B TaxID=2853592 RepID=UPI0035719167|nr:MAG: hypothetical protein KVP17_002857 [Porospora cf. gigantea B]
MAFLVTHSYRRRRCEPSLSPFREKPEGTYRAESRRLQGEANRQEDTRQYWERRKREHRSETNRKQTETRKMHAAMTEEAARFIQTRETRKKWRVEALAPQASKDGGVEVKGLEMVQRAEVSIKPVHLPPRLPLVDLSAIRGFSSMSPPSSYPCGRCQCCLARRRDTSTESTGHIDAVRRTISERYDDEKPARRPLHTTRTQASGSERLPPKWDSRPPVPPTITRHRHEPESDLSWLEPSALVDKIERNCRLIESRLALPKSGLKKHEDDNDPPSVHYR